jgi:hypothetical protein
MGFSMNRVITSPVKSYDCYIGLSDCREWKIVISREVCNIDSGDFHVKMALLPFLEVNFTDVVRKLKAAYGDEVSQENFPFLCFIKAGFEQKSRLIAADALNWLEHLGNAEISNFIEALERIVNQKAQPQKVRQIAKRLIKRGQKNT